MKPDIVIVWGCALGGELEKREFKKEAKFYGYNWENEGIQFVNSYHPSYGGFEDNGGLEEALDKAFQEASKVTNGWCLLDYIKNINEAIKTFSI